MRFPTYSSALEWLYARNQFSIKMGLERTRALLEAVGSPHRGGVYLHVAGTNGKGSVCLALSRMLSAVGIRRVGLYTSPHLVSFRERIRVDDEPLPAFFVTDWLNAHGEALESLNPTYFEIVTALAFAWFRECACEAVVLETGLGGRLDATNVITSRVAVVTSISLDHVAMLGDTLEAVQREKLGIVKPGGPLVVDEARPALARAAEAAARAAGAEYLNLADRLAAPADDAGHAAGRGAVWTLRGAHRTYSLPADLRAEDYQMRNAALAVLALEAFRGEALPPEAAWLPALRAARMPGRMQRLAARAPSRHVPVLLDGAHNPAGLRALAGALKRGGMNGPPPRARSRIFFAVMNDKDYEGMLAELSGLSDDLVYVDLTSINPRALPSETLLARVYGETASPAPDAAGALTPLPMPVNVFAHAPKSVRVIPPTREALMALLQAGSTDVAVFCGSLYMLGAVIPLLAPDYAGLEEFERLRREDESTDGNTGASSPESSRESSGGRGGAS